MLATVMKVLILSLLFYLSLLRQPPLGTQSVNPKGDDGVNGGRQRLMHHVMAASPCGVYINRLNVRSSNYLGIFTIMSVDLEPNPFTFLTICTLLILKLCV
jgi:hypothetical protein